MKTVSTEMISIQKLRGMNLHAVADELEQLRVFKEVVEKQEPEFDKKLFDSKCRASVSGALGFQRGGDYAWSYLLAQIKEVVKASEKQEQVPAVAVLDGWKLVPVEDFIHTLADFIHDKPGKPLVSGLKKEELTEDDKEKELDQLAQDFLGSHIDFGAYVEE